MDCSRTGTGRSQKVEHNLREHIVAVRKHKSQRKDRVKGDDEAIGLPVTKGVLTGWKAVYDTVVRSVMWHGKKIKPRSISYTSG